MARRTRITTPPGDDRIVDVDVSDEMRGSFLEYAYSVIYSRALPDARDGMKPVQRRILYQMAQMGLRPDRGHVKSARVVGEVMGRLHPHGDGAIYDALVRMVQPFAMRVPFVDGHGNFGSPDDGPAAMRYTECRLASSAISMTAGIDEDVVDFGPNYDGREVEPSVLPAAIPALLVNGAAGIAVGMATNLPPHNLGEVAAAIQHLLKHPNADLETLMRFVPGPDLPGGASIVGLDGIKEAYESGRGAFRMRATARVEQVTARKQGIVVTELPYGVGPEKVVERIADLVRSKKLDGISYVSDLTDGDSGLQILIEIKNGFVPAAVLEALYRLTPLEDSFNINSVALVDGQPRTLGLKEMLEVYIAHRLEVIRRRTSYRRTRAEDRLHLVDGLLIAIVDIDEVIQVIRASDDAAAAKARLMSVFDLSDAQTTYILDMPLRRLTKFSRIELETERETLMATISDLTDILESDTRLRKTVSDELTEVVRLHGTPRRTILLESTGQSRAALPLEIEDEPCTVRLSSTGLLARFVGDVVVGPRAAHDLVVSSVTTTTRGTFLMVTSAGRVVRVSTLELPALPTSATGTTLAGGVPLGALVDLDSGEQVLCLAPDAAGGLALGTQRGIVKRVTPEEPLSKDSWDVIRLDDGDRVVGAVALETDDVELVFVTSDAQLLHFPAAAVRPQGRSAGGMAGIRLSDGARVIFFATIATDAAEAVVVTIAGTSAALPGTDSGAAKVTKFSEYPGKGRATAGVRCQRFLAGEDELQRAWVGPGPARACSASGQPVDLPSDLKGRDASGSALAAPVDGIFGS